MIRDFYKKILVSKLSEELSEWSEKFDGIQLKTEGVNHFIVLLKEDLTPQEDIELSDLINDHIPSSSFLDQQELTDTRNKEGFDLYKKIFAHISDTNPITSIDGFIECSDKLHKLRNFLKDGNFETVVRYMYLEIKPMLTVETTCPLYGCDFDLYRGWCRELAIKYNQVLLYNSELVNPAFVGTPFEGVPFIDYIELAPQGQV